MLKRLFSRARALARVIALHPDAAVALLRWRPFSITSFEMLRNLRAQGIRPSTVIDGGANVGQFARAALETFPDVGVISFEPLPVASKKFREHLASEPRCRLVTSALGDTEGTVTFHPQEYDLASSVLPQRNQSATGTLEVPVTRLDTALGSDELKEPILLKLDLQGYELVALRGARATLTRVRWVLLEVGFRPSYEGEASFEQLYDFLVEQGFRFLRPIDVMTIEHGEVAQMDVLFERKR